MQRRVGLLLIIIVTWLMALAAPALAGGNGTDTGSVRGASAPIDTEDTDPYIRETPNTIVDDDDGPGGPATPPTTDPGTTVTVGRPLVPEISRGPTPTQLLPPLELDRLPHTGASTGLALLGGALVASGSALTGWAARRSQREVGSPTTTTTHAGHPVRRRTSTCRSAARSTATRRTAAVVRSVHGDRVGWRSSHRRPPIRGPSARGRPTS